MGEPDTDPMERLAETLRFDASEETIKRSIESARELERTATGLFDTEPSVEAIADTLAESSQVRVRRIDPDLGDVQDAYFLLSSAEFVWYYRQSGVVRGLAPNCDEVIRAELADMRERGVDSQHLAWRVLPPARVDEKLVGHGYTAAKNEAIRFQRELDTHFESVDLLLMPIIRDLPPEYGRMNSTAELLNLLGNTAPFNLTGMPAVSVPIADADGLPISAQVVAPAFADHRALRGPDSSNGLLGETLEEAGAADHPFIFELSREWVGGAI